MSREASFEQRRIDQAVQELVETSPIGGSVSINFSKNRGELRSIRTTVKEPYSLNALYRILRVLEYGDVSVVKDVDHEGNETYTLEHIRSQRFDK